MPSERLQRPVLVLNASYEPINICAARRALVLVLKGIAAAEELSVSAVHSPRRSLRWRLPLSSYIASSRYPLTAGLWFY